LFWHRFLIEFYPSLSSILFVQSVLTYDFIDWHYF
jgi:hypothetical protein